MLTNVQVESPDVCHRLGEFLCSPISIVAGRSYTIEKSKVTELPPESLEKRVIVAALAIILFPLTLIATLVGALILKCSVTYQKACAEVEEKLVTIDWYEKETEIGTKHLFLRLLRNEDGTEEMENIYRKIFHQDKDPGELHKQFLTSFAAILKMTNMSFCILDKEQSRTIGIFYLNYIGEKDPHIDLDGFIDPGYAHFRHGKKEVDRPEITEELIRASLAYAKALQEKGVWMVPENGVVPDGVDPSDIIQNAEGKPLMFKASLPKLRISENIVDLSILQKVVIDENGGKIEKIQRPNKNPKTFYTLDLGKNG